MGDVGSLFKTAAFCEATEWLSLNGVFFLARCFCLIREVGVVCLVWETGELDESGLEAGGVGLNRLV